MSVRVQSTFVPTYREFTNRVNELQRDYQRRIEQARKDAAKEAQKAAKAESDRLRKDFNDRIQRVYDQTNDRITIIDRDNRRRLNDLAEEVYTAMDNMGAQLWQGINDVNNRVNQVIDSVNKRFNEQDKRMASMEDRIKGLYDYIQDRQERGRQAVKDAVALYNEYMKKYPITKYLPEEARSLKIRLDNISSNPESAEAQALEIMTQLYISAERAVALEAAHIKAIEVTNEQITKVLTVVNSNRIIKHEEQGEIVELESDFWSRGRYSEIIKELDALKAELARDPDNDRLAEMRVRAQQLEEEADALRKEAIHKAIQSEARLTMAEDLVTACISQGYQVKLNPTTRLDEVGYIGGEVDNDWREGVFAIVTSPTGEEITITIEPQAGDENRVLFHRNDTHQMTDLEYIESIRRICNATGKPEYKRNIQAPSNCDNKHMPELQDGNNISRKGTAEKIRNNI